MRKWLSAAIMLWAGMATAQDRAGEFDYYVLALSWSPTWCAIEGDARGSEQCREDANFGWVLHGLWPQYEQGWPSYCNTVERNPSRAQTGSLAWLYGSGGSAWHQWNKHGRCTGLSATGYYDLSARAYERITRPALLRQLKDPVTLPASLIEEAFLQDNPDLSADGLTVTCRDRRIQEVRICLTKDLNPRDCAPDVARDCTLSDALLDPIR